MFSAFRLSSIYRVQCAHCSCSSSASFSINSSFMADSLLIDETKLSGHGTDDHVRFFHLLFQTLAMHDLIRLKAVAKKPALFILRGIAADIASFSVVYRMLDQHLLVEDS